MFLTDGHNPYLRGQDQLVVIGDIIAGGTKSVAVQHRSHNISV
jgi:hypothetical protein